MSIPITDPFSAEWIAGIRSRRQATQWLALGWETRYFRAYCCDINAADVMGMTKPPVVLVTFSPNPVCLGESLDWDFTGSYAPGASIDTYDIDMGDGHSYGGAASGSHTYGAVGKYTVTATITTDATPPLTMSAKYHVQVTDCEDPPTPEPPPPPVPIVPVTPPAIFGWLIAFDNNLGCLHETQEGAWVVRNSGAATIADNQGGYDPHWQVEQDSTLLENAILWRVQDGKIYRSVDCAQNWMEFVPVGPVPNPWADAPPPVVGDVFWVVRTDNIYQQGEHYFLGRYQNATSDWRSVIMKVTGNGATETWAATATTDLNVYGTVTGTSWTHSGGTWVDSIAPTADLAADDGLDCVFSTRYTGGGVTIEAHGNVTIDLGADYTLSAAQVNGNGNNIEFQIDAKNHTANGAACARDSAKLYTKLLPGDAWTQRVCVTPAVGIFGAALNAVTIRYVLLQWNRLNDNGQLGAGWANTLSFDYVRIYLGISGPAMDGYPIWMDTDTATGQYIYVTLWKSDGTISLQKRLTSDLSIDVETTLGVASISDVLANTYIARPRVKEFDPDIMYVYGRMTSPDGLAGLQHIIKSSDGGVTFASLISDWDTDYCGAFLAADVGDKVVAIRNTGAAPQYYRGIATPVLISTIVLATDVPSDALTGRPGAVAVGAGGAVVVSNDDGVSWVLQTGYPVGGNIRSLVYM